MPGRGRKVADAWIDIHGDTNSLRDDIEASGRSLDSLRNRLKKIRADQYEKDFDRIAKSLNSGDWKAWARGSTSLDEARVRLKKLTSQMKEFGQVSNRDVKRIVRSFDDYVVRVKRANRDVDRHGRLIGLIRKGVNKMRLSWARMDRTVKLVLTLILAAGDQVAVALVGIAGALAAIASSAGMALAAIIPLGIGAAGIGLAIAFAVQSMDELRDKIPGLEAAFDRVSDAWTAQVVEFGKAWLPALRDLSNAFAEVLGNTNIGAALGGAVGQVVEAFTGVVTSPQFASFLAAFEQQMPAAIKGIGEGFANMMPGILAAMEAILPVTTAMAEQFSKWAEGMSAAWEASAQSGQMTAFFENAATALSTVLDFLGSLTGALFTFFNIGATEGNSMLDTLTGLLDQWNAWMQTAEGESATLSFLSQARTAFEGIYPLVGSLATAIRDMVTPDAIERFLSLSNSLSELAPLLGDVLHTIGQLGILNILAEALVAVGTALEPLLPSFDRLFGLLSSMISEVITIITPLLTSIGSALAPLVDAISSLIEAVLPSLMPALERIVAALQPLLDLLGQLFTWIGTYIVPIIADVLIGVIDNVVGVVEGLSQFIQGMVAAVSAALSGDWAAAWEAVKSAVSGAVQAVWNFIQLWFLGKLLKGVGTLMTKIGSLFRNGWSSVTNGVANFVANIVSKITSFFSNLGGKISGGMSNASMKFHAGWNAIKTNIANAWNSIISNVSSAFSRMRSAISSGVSTAVGVVRTLPGKAVAALGNLGSRLIGAGRALIRGFISGITNMFSSVRSTLSNLTAKLTSWKGPEGRDRNLLVHAGQIIIGGLIGGLESKYDHVKDSLASLTDLMAEPFTGRDMFKTGKDASSALADGLLANRSNISSAFNDLMTANFPNGINVPETTVAQRAANATVPGGKTIIVGDGAVRVESNMADPALVAKKVVDEFAVGAVF